MIKRIKSLTFKISFIYGLSFFLSAFIFTLIANFVLQTAYEPPFDEVQSLFSDYDVNIDQLLDDPDFQQEIQNIQENSISEVRLRILFTLILFTMISMFIGYLLSKSMPSPIKELNKTTKLINENQLNTKIDTKNVDDELGELVENFNTMLERLNISFESQKHFVENASHELKTPLTIMKSNAESALLRQEISNSELKSSLKKVVKSADNMNLLVDNLLSLAQTGMKKIDLVKISLDESIKSAIRQIDNLANDKEIKISYENHNEFKILGSPTLLNKVWINLLENAIKYSDKGSEVLITTKEKEGSIFIDFIDQGKGIPKEKIKYIFDRFYRVDNSRSKTSGGNGIGLSIVKAVIELHGGSVSVTSKINKGSTFSIELPFIEK